MLTYPYELYIFEWDVIHYTANLPILHFLLDMHQDPIYSPWKYSYYSLIYVVSMQVKKRMNAIWYNPEIFAVYQYEFFFVFQNTLQSLDIDHLTINPPTCSCSSSPFNYSQAGHIITCDVDIIEKHSFVKVLILENLGLSIGYRTSYPLWMLSKIIPNGWLNVGTKN
jgi:hypothetical protein